MLRKLDEKEINNYIDFAYTLALDITKSSYPTFTDGIKSKINFINATTYAFNSNSEEILLFENNNTVLGWTQYYYNEEDNSINIYTFLCEQNFNMMLIGFLEYINKKYPKKKVFMGFPSENMDACNSLINNGFKLLEQSYNNVLHLENYVIRDYDYNVEKLDIKDFLFFKKLHDNSDIDIYWNSERIFNEFNEWIIYVYKINKEIIGSIYCKDERLLLEVFGIDYIGNEFNINVFNALFVNFLNDMKTMGKKNIIYFAALKVENEMLKRFGFKYIGEYKYFELSN